MPAGTSAPWGCSKQIGDGFTVEDWLARPDDGLRYELIDGSMIVSPPPVPRHQRVVNRLMEQMRPGLPPGMAWTRGAGVAPSDRGAHQALVPDIMVTTWLLAGIREANLLPEDVVLAVEVVSSSSWRRDHNDTSEILAACGIEHYWIVDLSPQPRATVLWLGSGRYVEVASAGPPGTVVLTEPFAGRLDLAAVFE